MAETLISPLGNILRDSKILVNVDHASEECLVVSFTYKTQLYQGVLLDSTNRFLPCGYPSQEVVRWSPPRVEPLPETPSPAQDTNRPFYSLCNRFTYFQDVLFQKNVAMVKSAKQARAKAQKMTVRLRPRQVLCSKCRSICNENSENVHSATNNKKDKNDSNSNIKNLLTENSSNENQNLKSPRKVRTTLVPKLSRLEPEDIRELNGARSEGRSWSEMLEADKQMVLRKKRSVGSMEDLWDETVFEEAAKKAKTTPIIKISFGSPGEGTVLKIPSKVQISGSEGEEETKDTPDTKALKKAMKKAKKEAKRKASPERLEEPTSPSEPNYKKHRHRVKHKKKHKNSKEEEMKDKCLKQKLSINLKRVCGGPGEEESWSGESSRSSEPVKDFDESKQIESISLEEPFQQLSAISQLQQPTECKENQQVESKSSQPSPSHRVPRTTALRRKKLETLESLLRTKEAECKKGSLSDILGKAILNEENSAIKPSSSVNISSGDKSALSDRKGPFSSENTAQRLIILNPEAIKCPDSIVTPLIVTESLNQVLRPCIKVKEPSEIIPFNETKDAATNVDIDISRMEPTNVEDEASARSSGQALGKGRQEFYCEDQNKLRLPLYEENIKPFEADPSLAENIKNIDHNDLELEETGENIFSETKNEVPEDIDQLEKKLIDTPSVESSLHVTDTQYQLSDNDLKDDPSKLLICLPDQQSLDVDKTSDKKDISQTTFISNESNRPGSQESVSEDILPSSELEPAEPPQSSDDFHSVSTKMECSEDRCTTDEPVDSSEDSEFLPAEDELYCPPESESVFSAPKISLDHSSREGDSDSAPPLLDCASSEDIHGCAPLEDIIDCPPPPLIPAPTNTLNYTPSNLDSPPPLERLDHITPDHRLDNSESISGCVPPNLDYSSSKASLDCAPPDLHNQDFGSSNDNLGCIHRVDNLNSSPPKLSLDCTPPKEIQDHTLLESNQDVAPTLERLDRASSKESIDQTPPNLEFGPVESIKTSENQDVALKKNNLESSSPLVSLGRASTEIVSNSEDIPDCPSVEDTFDSVPNFPASSPRDAPQDVTSCRNEDGSVLSVGDIVWAKIHDFPWWPAKVVRLCVSTNEGSGCDARVAWFGSATSSLMSADQLSPFIQTFKAKYNRERKSTGYREAIRQATTEASSRDFDPPQPIAEINELLAQ